MIELRPYQLDAVDQTEQAFGTAARPILVAPTGSGKTVIFVEVVKRCLAKHGRVLVVAHRREIIEQTAGKLRAHGLQDVGIIMAGVEPRPFAPVQVASIQTLWARGMRSKAMAMPPATLVVIDEAHHSQARTYQKLLDAYPDASILGATATPCRGDGRGLGNIFNAIIECPQVADLIVGGFLVKSKVYAPVDPDLRGVRVQTGDYAPGQLARRMDTDILVGNIVSDWLKHGERRKTVAFAVDVAHSVHIREEFLGAGVRAEHLDGSTPIKDREAILARLASGETELVSNCMVLTEGWDMPAVGCCILARPTKQMGLFRQMIGRVLRPADGKPDAIILDHSGAVYRHGLPEDHIEWTLDVDQRAENPVQAKRKSGEEAKLAECPGCKVLLCGPPPCGHCGWMPPQRRGRYLDFEDGELGLVIDGGLAHGQEMTRSEQLQFYRELRGFAIASGMKGADGWAFYKCKEKGFKPPWAWKENFPPLDPSPEVAAWAKSRLIAYAKRRLAA